MQFKSDCSHAFAQSIDNSDDDYLPPLEDVSQPCFPTKASVKILKPERNQQHNEEPASDATGTHIEHAILGLEGRPGASQGRLFSSRVWQAAANDPQTNR
jgi:hypothetical protein